MPRFGGVYFCIDTDALHPFKSRGFGGEIGLVAANIPLQILLP